MMAYLQKLLKDTSGFSIVELGVVIIIGALMTIPIYTLLFYVTDLKPTDERVEIIQEALAEHLRVTGTLPCPADPTLNIDTNPNAYQANCADVTLSNDVYIGAVPVQNLKVAVDCAANNGEVDARFTDSLKDNIYNVRELITGRSAAGNESLKADGVRCLQNEYILNAEGQKFIYAVSVNATQAGFDLFDPAAGRVIIRNSAGNNIDNNRLYVLVSLGDDGKGGYDRNGTLVAGGCAAGDLDSENCNNDHIFVAAPQNTSNANYFDDTIEYGIARFMNEGSFWQWDDNGGTPDLTLNTNTALIIDPTDTINAAGDPIDENDRLVVNRGSLRVAGDLNINAQSYGVGANVAGGELETPASITVDKNITAHNIARANRYCYSPSLSDACNDGSTGSGNTGGTQSCDLGYEDDDKCCNPADESHCCPADVYDRTPYACYNYWD